MNTLLDKLEKIILTTPSGENRNSLTEITVILTQQLNLCDSCKHHIATCNSSIVTFGTGRGNDNISKCNNYDYKR